MCLCGLYLKYPPYVTRQMKPVALKIIRLSLLSIALIGCGAPAEQEAPDLILVGGNIITVDSTDRIAEALAIKENVITAIGTTQEIEALAGEATQRIDLNNRTVTPGLLDAHIHFSASPWSIPNMIDLSYPNVKSITEAKALIAQKAKAVKPGEWIQGVGWDEGKLEEQRLITARDLDEVSPDHPVWLRHTTGHYGVVNSAALELANINSDTPNPPEGIIDRDPSGKATGVLKESAMDLVYEQLPPSTIEDIEAGIIHMTKALHKEGMTGIKDPTLTDKRWQAYQNVLDAGHLNLRVFGLWIGGKSKKSMSAVIDKQLAIPDQFRIGNDHLISGGIKLFADGSGGARTAWLYDEWNKNVTETDQGNYGFPNIAPDTLDAMIRMGHEAGVHVSTHAIGDRTIDMVVNSYRQALQAQPTRGLRHGIIHANIPTQQALETMQKLQSTYDAGYPEPSATFTWWIGDTYAGNFGERARRLNPFATFKKMGIIWANGSDYSVTPFAARYGIWSAIARQPALGTYDNDPFGRGEAVDVKTALKAVTLWAAHQLFLDDKIGSIEIGKYADLAVWDRNLYTVPTDEIKDMKCLMTFFNGEIVYRAEDFQQ